MKLQIEGLWDVRDDGSYLNGVKTVFGVPMVVRCIAVRRIRHPDGESTQALDVEDDDDVDAIQSFDPDAVPDLVTIEGYPHEYLVVIAPMGVG